MDSDPDFQQPRWFIPLDTLHPILRDLYSSSSLIEGNTPQNDMESDDSRGLFDSLEYDDPREEEIQNIEYNEEIGFRVNFSDQNRESVRAAAEQLVDEVIRLALEKLETDSDVEEFFDFSDRNRESVRAAVEQLVDEVIRLALEKLETDSDVEEFFDAEEHSIMKEDSVHELSSQTQNLHIPNSEFPVLVNNSFQTDYERSIVKEDSVHELSSQTQNLHIPNSEFPVLVNDSSQTDVIGDFVDHAETNDDIYPDEELIGSNKPVGTGDMEKMEKYRKMTVCEKCEVYLMSCCDYQCKLENLLIYSAALEKKRSDFLILLNSYNTRLMSSRLIIKQSTVKQNELLLRCHELQEKIRNHQRLERLKYEEEQELRRRKKAYLEDFSKYYFDMKGRESLDESQLTVLEEIMSKEKIKDTFTKYKPIEDIDWEKLPLEKLGLVLQDLHDIEETEYIRKSVARDGSEKEIIPGEKPLEKSDLTFLKEFISTELLKNVFDRYKSIGELDWETLPHERLDPILQDLNDLEETEDIRFQLGSELIRDMVDEIIDESIEIANRKLLEESDLSALKGLISRPELKYVFSKYESIKNMDWEHLSQERLSLVLQDLRDLEDTEDISKIIVGTGTINELLDKMIDKSLEDLHDSDKTKVTRSIIDSDDIPVDMLHKKSDGSITFAGTEGELANLIIRDTEQAMKKERELPKDGGAGIFDISVKEKAISEEVSEREVEPGSKEYDRYKEKIKSEELHEESEDVEKSKMETTDQRDMRKSLESSSTRRPFVTETIQFQKAEVQKIESEIIKPQSFQKEQKMERIERKEDFQEDGNISIQDQQSVKILIQQEPVMVIQEDKNIPEQSKKQDDSVKMKERNLQELDKKEQLMISDSDTERLNSEEEKKAQGLKQKSDTDFKIPVTLEKFEPSKMRLDDSGTSRIDPEKEKTTIETMEDSRKKIDEEKEKISSKEQLLETFQPTQELGAPPPIKHDIRKEKQYEEMKEASDMKMQQRIDDLGKEKGAPLPVKAEDAENTKIVTETDEDIHHRTEKLEDISDKTNIDSEGEEGPFKETRIMDDIKMSQIIEGLEKEKSLPTKTGDADKSRLVVESDKDIHDKAQDLKQQQQLIDTADKKKPYPETKDASDLEKEKILTFKSEDADKAKIVPELDKDIPEKVQGPKIQQPIDSEGKEKPYQETNDLKMQKGVGDLEKEKFLPTKSETAYKSQLVLGTDKDNLLKDQQLKQLSQLLEDKEKTPHQEIRGVSDSEIQQVIDDLQEEKPITMKARKADNTQLVVDSGKDIHDEAQGSKQQQVIDTEDKKRAFQETSDASSLKKEKTLPDKSEDADKEHMNIYESDKFISESDKFISDKEQIPKQQQVFDSEKKVEPYQETSDVSDMGKEKTLPVKSEDAGKAKVDAESHKDISDKAQTSKEIESEKKVEPYQETRNVSDVEKEKTLPVKSEDASKAKVDAESDEVIYDKARTSKKQQEIEPEKKVEPYQETRDVSDFEKTKTLPVKSEDSGKAKVDAESDEVIYDKARTSKKQQEIEPEKKVEPYQETRDVSDFEKTKTLPVKSEDSGKAKMVSKSDKDIPDKAQTSKKQQETESEKKVEPYQETRDVSDFEKTKTLPVKSEDSGTAKVDAESDKNISDKAQISKQHQDPDSHKNVEPYQETRDVSDFEKTKTLPVKSEDSGTAKVDAESDKNIPDKAQTSKKQQETESEKKVEPYQETRDVSDFEKTKTLPVKSEDSGTAKVDAESDKNIPDKAQTSKKQQETESEKKVEPYQETRDVSDFEKEKILPVKSEDTGKAKIVSTSDKYISDKAQIPKKQQDLDSGKNVEPFQGRRDVSDFEKEKILPVKSEDTGKAKIVSTSDKYISDKAQIPKKQQDLEPEKKVEPYQEAKDVSDFKEEKTLPVKSEDAGKAKIVSTSDKYISDKAQIPKKQQDLDSGKNVEPFQGRRDVSDFEKEKILPVKSEDTGKAKIVSTSDKYISDKAQIPKKQQDLEPEKKVEPYQEAKDVSDFKDEKTLPVKSEDAGKAKIVSKSDKDISDKAQIPKKQQDLDSEKNVEPFQGRRDVSDFEKEKILPVKSDYAGHAQIDAESDKDISDKAQTSKKQQVTDTKGKMKPYQEPREASKGQQKSIDSKFLDSLLSEKKAKDNEYEKGKVKTGKVQPTSAAEVPKQDVQMMGSEKKRRMEEKPKPIEIDELLKKEKGIVGTLKQTKKIIEEKIDDSSENNLLVESEKVIDPKDKLKTKGFEPQPKSASAKEGVGLANKLQSVEERKPVMKLPQRRKIKPNLPEKMKQFAIDILTLDDLNKLHHEVIKATESFLGLDDTGSLESEIQIELKKLPFEDLANLHENISRTAKSKYLRANPQQTMSRSYQRIGLQIPEQRKSLHESLDLKWEATLRKKLIHIPQYGISKTKVTEAQKPQIYAETNAIKKIGLNAQSVAGKSVLTARKLDIKESMTTSDSVKPKTPRDQMTFPQRNDNIKEAEKASEIQGRKPTQKKVNIVELLQQLTNDQSFVHNEEQMKKSSHRCHCTPQDKKESVKQCFCTFVHNEQQMKKSSHRCHCTPQDKKVSVNVKRPAFK